MMRLLSSKQLTGVGGAPLYSTARRTGSEDLSAQWKPTVSTVVILHLFSVRKMGQGDVLAGSAARSSFRGTEDQGKASGEEILSVDGHGGRAAVLEGVAVDVDAGVRWFDSNVFGLLSSKVEAISSATSAKEGNSLWSLSGNAAESSSHLCTVDLTLSRLCFCMSQATRCTPRRRWR